ncbi:hypothetical protein EHO59_08670 [Leptospira semungkisensis]|uniref:Lipoprotein n=1 Tax=Leptospira semungkisensis TaxID=2484985 RepID=A0A4R9G0L9_9LEPT|nr:hypothetical protein [Leptospira semungkisensis]TGK04912.1 hypothetical protein EHO59_08670 [Leptospira semungkisensis]
MNLIISVNKSTMVFLFKKASLLVAILAALNCGAALTYQQTEEAAQQNNSSTSSSELLAALGISGGGSGLAKFSASHLSIQAGNTGSYDIVFSKWPLTGLHGTINVSLTIPGALSDMSLFSFNVADDQGYPITFTNTVSAGLKPGSGTIQHNIDSAPDSSLNNTSLGTVTVTVK